MVVFFFNFFSRLGPSFVRGSMAHRHGVPGSTPGSGSSSGSSQPLPNSSFGDTAYTKLFVGGLAWETRSEALRRYFERFGEILEAVVITHKNTGKSKGYGFVSVPSRDVDGSSLLWRKMASFLMEFLGVESNRIFLA